MTRKRVEVVASRHVFSGKVFDLMVDQVTYPNGVSGEFAKIRHPGAAAIVPLTGDDQVILIHQYRHSLGETIFEIPAGTRDPAEAIEICARRELTEETGYRAGQIERIGSITPVPGYCNEVVTLFLAMDLAPAEQRLDDDEVLEVRKIPFFEAIAMAMDGRIQDAKSIAGLLFAARHLGWMRIGK